MQNSASEIMDGGGGAAGDGGVVKRACDQCRIRKIRCDKESPCSNCRIAQRTCSSTGLGQKPKEHRQRVLISSQYEKKIDYFGNRLAGIEDLLRELTISLKNPPASTSSTSGTTAACLPLHTTGPHNAPSSSNARTTPSSGAANIMFDDGDDSDDTSSDLGDSTFEGQSSLTAHTVQASEFLEHVVERERWSNHHMNPNMQSALSSLQRIVCLQQHRKKGDVKFPNQKPLPPGGFKDLPMPPAQIVLGILREIKEKPPITFTLVCAFIGVEDFTESCRKVYFATEDFNLSTFIVVNAGLYYLFQEKMIVKDEFSGAAAEHLAYHHMCRDNLETALANLPFFLPPKMETIEALLLGAGYAIELSKPSLAWQLNCSAATLCTSLGYHRLACHQGPSDETPSQASPPKERLSEKKQALFWFAYMLDKGLALRFGRASVLQDYDIALPKAIPGTGSIIGRVAGPAAAPDPWKDVLAFWIQLAEIQGQTYEYLYSSTALQRSVEERVESARMLVAKLTTVAARTSELHAVLAAEESRKNDDAFALMSINMALKSDEVSHYSALALIYRAIPPSEHGRPSRFNDECIAAARAAFASHQECMEITASSLSMNAAYLHWTVLYAPFVPFIVIFCHAIETSDKEDLKRLEQFANSLHAARAVSGAVDKLHRLCRIMCDVAALYVEAKEAEHQTADANMTPLGNDFNMYLSQLGLVPPAQPSFDAGGDAAAGGLDSDMLSASYQAAQLGDWFEGGTHMMGLLEEDLSQFQPEPGVWPTYGLRQGPPLVNKPP